MKRDDSHWMRLAIRLAKKGMGWTRPNPPVGAVIVLGSRVLGKGYHHKAGSAHAEILAIREAGGRTKGATLYVTLEPCSTRGRTGPCTKAILKAGIVRVVAGTCDPNPRHSGRGLSLLKRKGISVKEGVCGAECNEIIAPFRKWISTGMPYVTLKMGLSMDGRIADAWGRSRWVTCKASRAMVQAMRAKVDAILVGATTVRTDNPSLMRCGGIQNGMLRVVVSSDGNLPSDLKIFTDVHRMNTILAVTRRCASWRVRALRQTGIEVLVLPSKHGKVSVRILMRRLGEKGLLHVLCEGGGELASSLVDSGMVNEFVFFVSGILLGGPGSRSVMTGKHWPLGLAPRLVFTRVRRVGQDIMITAKPDNQESNVGRNTNGS